MLGDFFHLGHGYSGHLVAVRLAGTFFHLGGLEEQHRGRGRFGEKGERPVRIHRDDHRNDQTFLVLGFRVKGLAKLHDVQAVLAQGGTHGRRGVGRAGRNLELNFRYFFFGHGRITLKLFALTRAKLFFTVYFPVNVRLLLS